MSNEITEFFRRKDKYLKVRHKCLTGLVYRGNYNDDSIELVVEKAIRSNNPQEQHKSIKTMMILMDKGYFNTS